MTFPLPNKLLLHLATVRLSRAVSKDGLEVGCLNVQRELRVYEMIMSFCVIEMIFYFVSLSLSV